MWNLKDKLVNIIKKKKKRERGRETHRYKEQSVVTSREKEKGRCKTRLEN